jgi:hypothetical protein
MEGKRMENIKVALKRFLKNKNTVTIIALLTSLAILYYAYNLRIKKATEPISVPYAVRRLEPRTLIENKDVGIKQVPGGMVNGRDVIASSSLIVGKYVSEKVEIPLGSLFYDETVVTWEQLPSSLFEDIPNDYTVITMPVSLETTYGNSIFTGNYIDLYFAGYDYDDKLIVAKFIESIRVLAVIDGHGNNIFEKSSNVEPPSYLMFSIPEDLHLLLRKAIYKKVNLFPVPRNAEYSLKPNPTKVSSTYIRKLIEQQTIDVSEKDLELNPIQGGNQ